MAKAKAKAKTKAQSQKKAQKTAKPKTKAKTKAAASKPKAKSKAKAQSKQKAKSPSKVKAKTKAAAKAQTKAKPKAKTKKAAPRAKSKSKSTAAPKSKTQSKAKTTTRKSSVSKVKAKVSVTPSRPTSKKTATRRARPIARAPILTSMTATPDVLPSGDSQFQNFTPYQPKGNELYMSDEQLVHFRQILTNWRHELMEEVDRTVNHMQDEAANFPDPADRATQEEEFSIELRTRDRERKLIKKIDQTIERLDQEDYGYCDTCGIEIGLRRLEARPTATQCVDCKSLDEIKERQILG